METHKKEIKKLHHFGLNFSDISKQTGISRKTISKYISGDISDTKMRQPSRDIMTEQVLTYTGTPIIHITSCSNYTTLIKEMQRIWIFITY
jgi:transcriptional regulator with XRE-family HTH domain